MNSEMSLARTAQTLKIVTLAMVMGVVTFGFVAVFVLGALEPAGEIEAGAAIEVDEAEEAGAAANLPLLSYVAGLFTLVAFGLHLVLPEAVARQTLSRLSHQPEAAAQAFQLRTILALAILEAAAFMNIVACIVEHQWWSLALAGGLVFWMLARVPSEGMITRWLEQNQPAAT